MARARRNRRDEQPCSTRPACDDYDADWQTDCRQGRKPMTITLTPDVAAALAEQAKHQGTTPEALANEYLRRDVLTSASPEKPVSPGETMADFFAGLVGVLHSSEKVPGGARMSENIGEKFAEGMVEKRKQGR